MSQADLTASPETLESDPNARWPTLIGHDRIKHWFANAIAKDRLRGSLLMVGPPGIGKRTIATLTAQTVLCQNSDPARLAPCGVCQDCQQVAAETHLDVIRVRKPADRSYIPVELFIGPRETRMQEGFCRDIRTRPVRGRHKIGIIEDADYFNEECANCLLKTLEEPPAGALIMLIGTSEQRQLPTIRSRCQVIRIPSPSSDDAVRLLQQVHGIQAEETQIRQTLELVDGDILAARRWLSDDTSQTHLDLIKLLEAPNPDPIALNRFLAKETDAAGKEASKRRDRLRGLLTICLQHYRRQLRSEAEHGTAQPITLARLDRSIRALREVDRNANQSTLIECVAVDLAAGTTGDRGDIGS